MDHILGFCSFRQEAVIDETCLDCFTDPAHVQIRAAAKGPGGLPRRHLCVAEHVIKVSTPDCSDYCQVRLDVRDDVAPAPVLAEDLNQLSEDALRHIIGNAVMVAESHPDSPAARTLLEEVRFHVKERREELGRWEARVKAQNMEVERRSAFDEVTF